MALKFNMYPGASLPGFYDRDYSSMIESSREMGEDLGTALRAGKEKFQKDVGSLGPLGKAWRKYNEGPHKEGVIPMSFKKWKRSEKGLEAKDELLEGRFAKKKGWKKEAHEAFMEGRPSYTDEEYDEKVEELMSDPDYTGDKEDAKREATEELGGERASKAGAFTNWLKSDEGKGFKKEWKQTEKEIAGGRGGYGFSREERREARREGRGQRRGIRQRIQEREGTARQQDIADRQRSQDLARQQRIGRRQGIRGRKVEDREIRGRVRERQRIARQQDRGDIRQNIAAQAQFGAGPLAPGATQIPTSPMVGRSAFDRLSERADNLVPGRGILGRALAPRKHAVYKQMATGQFQPPGLQMPGGGQFHLPSMPEEDFARWYGDIRGASGYGGQARQSGQYAGYSPEEREFFEQYGGQGGAIQRVLGQEGQGW